MQLLEPLAVHDIGLPTGDVLHVTRVDEDYVEAARLEDLVEGDPVDAGGFHGHGGHAARGEPVSEALEIRREGRERAHWGRVPVGGNGDVVRFGAAIDARGIRVHALQK
jgi:hypothetical protein